MKEEFIEQNNFDEEKNAFENKKEDFSKVFIHVKSFLNNLTGINDFILSFVSPSDA